MVGFRTLWVVRHRESSPIEMKIDDLDQIEVILEFVLTFELDEIFVLNTFWRE